MDIISNFNFSIMNNEKLELINGGTNWWGMVNDISTILGIEYGTFNLILSLISVTNPWVLPLMATCGVAACAAFVW